MAIEVRGGLTKDRTKIILRMREWNGVTRQIINDNVPGRQWMDRDQRRAKGMPEGAYFYCRATLDNVRLLKEYLSDWFVMDNILRARVRLWVRKEREIEAMLAREHADPERLRAEYPRLYAWCNQRPYQLVDIEFGAHVENGILNMSDPGMGKTFETIGIPYEAGIAEGPKLVIAPIDTMEAVWQQWLEEFVHDETILIWPERRLDQENMIEQVRELARTNWPFWFVLNPAQVLPQRRVYQNALRMIHWKYLVVDEFHLCGLAVRPKFHQGAAIRGKTAAALAALKADKKVVTSATPISGKFWKVWPILNFLAPDDFTSFWNWANRWLLTGTDPSGHRTVGDLRPDLEEAFYRAHSRYLIRRRDTRERKANNIWVKMEEYQAKQYAEFAEKAEVKIEEEHLVGVGILAEYTRLRQFAIAAQRLENSIPYPTAKSGKFPEMERLLHQHGIGGPEDDGRSQAIIYTQFTKVAKFVAGYLAERGIETAVISGGQKREERRSLVAAFERRNEPRQRKRGPFPRVLCIQTKTGGVGITLDQSDVMIFLDETWTPDDTRVQAEGRNRQNSATIYYIRTRDTIEEYVYSLNLQKQITNSDLRELRERIHAGRVRA